MARQGRAEQSRAEAKKRREKRRAEELTTMAFGEGGREREREKRCIRRKKRKWLRFLVVEQEEVLHISINCGYQPSIEEEVVGCIHADTCGASTWNKVSRYLIYSESF